MSAQYELAFLVAVHAMLSRDQFEPAGLAEAAHIYALEITKKLAEYSAATPNS